MAYRIIFSKIVHFLIAVTLAPVAAYAVGYVAFSQSDIRTSALESACFLALIIALLSVMKWIEWPRKSK
jgi:hypothetical protein